MNAICFNRHSRVPFVLIRKVVITGWMCRKASRLNSRRGGGSAVKKFKFSLEFAAWFQIPGTIWSLFFHGYQEYHHGYASTAMRKNHRA